MASFLRKKLEGSLRNANRQIKQSRALLKDDSCLGLLILVNDGNSALTPAMVEHVIARSLRQKFSSINSVVHFSANMPGSVPHINRDVLYWCNWGVKSVRPPVPSAFIDRLREVWFAHHSAAVGETIPEIPASLSDLQKFAFLKDRAL